MLKILVRWLAMAKIFFLFINSLARYYHSVYNSPMANESTKMQIQEISTNLFAQKGYDAVGIQEIVDTAGITKPALYYYFGSKKGLLQNIVLENEEKHFGLMQKAADYEQRFFESLTKMLRAEIDFAVSAPDYFRLRTNLLNSPEHSECYEVFYPYAKKIENLMLDFFNLSAKEFGNMKGKEELYSSLFLANICSIAMRVSSGLMKSDEKILYTIVHSFVYGFAD